jgi:hypothetical protein
VINVSFTEAMIVVVVVVAVAVLIRRVTNRR